MRYLLILCLLTTSGVLYSQKNKKELDKAAIKSMCGCYSVKFDYAETFFEDTAYRLHDQYHTGASAEWIFVEEEDENKIVIQHLLVINDTMIIKHWRQDWLYENQDIYSYNKDMNWNYVQLPKDKVKGQWTQKVYQVDDSPRYEGSATWVMVDGKTYWENTTDAPLPRREFTKRSDYNVMQRTNNHIITDYGWLHEQDNLKVVREDGKPDKVLVAEKGLNKYTKIDDKNCQAGKDWWEKNKVYWAAVREQWDVVFAEKKPISIKKGEDGKKLWEELFELGDKYENSSIEKKEEIKAEVNKIFSKYIV